MSSNQTKNADVAALYARISSDLQNAASIDDQLRVCAERAAKQGWLVAGSYTDQGISGASLIRPGIHTEAPAGRCRRKVRHHPGSRLTACPRSGGHRPRL